MTTPARIPADVDREDRLIGNLTARQLAILAGTGAILYALWTFAARVLPVWSPTWAAASPGMRLAGFAIAAIPIAVAGLALTLGRRDGMALDRLLLAAARQRLAIPTDRRAAHPHGPDGAPSGAARRGAGADSDVASAHARAGRVVVARVPARDVRASITRPDVGVVELGRDGLALVCAVTPVNLMLRSPGEQDQIVTGMARWLHSLTRPVQVLVRTTPLDLTGYIAELRAQAARCAHPALAAAGNAHADHLTDLAHHTDLLRRRIYLVFHEPVPARHPSRKPSDGARADRIRRAVRAAEDQLLRRAEEADQLLGAIGARVTPLDPAATADTLLAATNPDQHLHPPAHPTPTQPTPRPTTRSATGTSGHAPAHRRQHPAPSRSWTPGTEVQNR